MVNIYDILKDTLMQLATKFSSFISNFISAAIILLVGWLIAKLVAYIVKNVFSKMGIDKLGDKVKEIDAIKKFNLEFKLSEVVSKVVYVFIMLFLSVSAADTLGVPAISGMFLMLVNFIPKLIVAIVMTLIGLFVSDLARNFIVTLCKSFNIASGKLIGMGVFFIFIFITLILALGQAGINTVLLESSFNILIGALALAFAIGYGFASKDILLNIISSFYSRNKYKIGQIIEIEGVRGEIVEIDNTNIILKSSDQRTIFPLKILQTHKVIVFD